MKLTKVSPGKVSKMEIDTVDELDEMGINNLNNEIQLDKQLEEENQAKEKNEINVHRLEEADEADKPTDYFFDQGSFEIHDQIKLQLMSGKDQVKLWKTKDYEENTLNTDISLWIYLL